MRKHGSESHVFIGWNWIFHCLFLHPKSVAMILILTLFIYGCGMAIPLCTQHAIDQTIGGHGYKSSLWLALIAVISVLSDISLSNTRHKYVLSLGTTLEKRLSKKLLLRILRSDTANIAPYLGDVLNNLQKTSRVRNFVLQTIPQIIFEIGYSLVAACLLFYYDIIIGSVVVVITTLIALVMRGRIDAFQEAARSYHKVENVRQSFIAETVNALYTVKAQAIEFQRFIKWKAHTSDFTLSITRYHTLGRRFGMRAQLASRIIGLIVICLGTYRLATHQISVGDLLAIQMLSGRFISPIIGSADVFRQLSEINASFDNLNAIFQFPIETSLVRPAAKKIRTNGISVRNLNYLYANSKQAVLNQINFELPDRGVYVIVGKNGSGKTTLMRILSGIVSNYEGEVLVGGNELRTYHPRWFRNIIGVVEQDSVLFSGTIRDNITLGKRNYSEDDIWRALELSGASSVVMEFEHKLDQEIVDGGRMLSGGQRQRLSISRALIKKPSIILLDEPTAFLDPEAGSILERNIADLGTENLVLIITHNLSSAVTADGVLVMEDGQIQSFGIHSKLVKECPHYSYLWRKYTESKD